MAEAVGNRRPGGTGARTIASKKAIRALGIQKDKKHLEPELRGPSMAVALNDRMDRLCLQPALQMQPLFN